MFRSTGIRGRETQRLAQKLLRRRSRIIRTGSILLGEYEQPNKTPSRFKARSMLLAHTIDINRNDHCARLLSSTVTPTTFENVDELSQGTKVALERAGMVEMTEIQQLTLNPILNGQDVTARARTGTGKTMAFLIPGVERILALRRTNPYAGVQMLIVAPTRELAEQIYREASLLTQQHEFLSVQVIYGGLPKGRDISRFQTKIPEILITTPGRILDHLDSTIIDDVPFQECLSQTSLLVLDEMDRLLDMGFFKDISDILKFLPTQENRQTLLFSATIPTTVKSMMDACVRPSNHVFVDCIVEDDPTTHTNASIEQSYVLLPPDRLVSGIAELIQNICKTTDDAKILVFFPTTAQVQFYTSLFTNLGHRVLQIHSKMTQAMRMNMSDQFRWARKGILFTTDITSRGIHYDNVSHVIQVGVANNRSTYVHRVGRTSRMQKTGHGLLVLIDLELEYLKQDLKGLDIRPNHRLQGLLDGPVPTSLQDDLMRIQHEMQNGQAEELAESATNVYTSILGYYSNRLRSLGVRSPDLLVEMINAFANQAGLVELPAISSKLARQNGLFGHSRIHVDARWTPGSTFQVGKQGKKER